MSTNGNSKSEGEYIPASTKVTLKDLAEHGIHPTTQTSDKKAVAQNVAIGASIVGGTAATTVGVIAAGTSATGAISAAGAVIVGCLLLAGCGGSEAEAKKAVLANLKDPDSAKFGKFTQVGEKLACMTVNAKNSMGGYTGDKQAFLEKVDGKWEFYFTQDVSHDMCIEMWPKIVEK
jgi:hypothetical protein